MALIECKECGHQVSKKAKKCPSCGAPVPFQFGMGCIIAIVAAVIIIVALASNGNSEQPVAKQGTATAGHGRQEHIRFLVKPTRLNVRSGPGLKHKIVGSVKRGSMVKSIERKSGWHRISAQPGVPEGWVYGKLLLKADTSKDLFWASFQIVTKDTDVRNDWGRLELDSFEKSSISMTFHFKKKAELLIARTMSQGLAQTAVALLIAQDRNPSKEGIIINVWVQAPAGTTSPTGKPQVVVYGKSVYDPFQDKISWVPSSHTTLRWFQ